MKSVSSYFVGLILSFLSFSAFASAPLQQGQQLQGRYLVNGVDQNQLCTLDVVSLTADSEKGIDCYSYSVRISEPNVQDFTVTSDIFKINNSGKYCDSAQLNIGEFLVSSVSANQELHLEFSGQGKLKDYRLIRLTGFISKTVYSCQFE